MKNRQCILRIMLKGSSERILNLLEKYAIVSFQMSTIADKSKSLEVNMKFLFVALGGAIGATGRYTISLIPIKTEFPILTLITNIFGAVMIGFIVGIVSEKDDVSPNTVLFWKTGICGGFTTFSTFSLEAVTLLENKSFLAGSIYIALSVIGCIIGVWSGRKLSILV